MIRQIAQSQDLLLEHLLDRRAARRLGTHALHAKLAAALPPPSGARVLELGCGPGKYVAMLCALGYTVIGIDPHAFPTWKLLRAKTAATLIDKIRGEQLPFLDATFDHVVCLGTLLYVDDPQRVIGEIRRVVKPGGKVIVRSINRGNLYTRRTGKTVDPASKNLYSLDELAALVASCGLRVEDRYAYGFLPPALTAFWWYLVCVWLPIGVQDALSALLPSAARWNNTVVASVPNG